MPSCGQKTVSRGIRKSKQREEKQRKKKRLRLRASLPRGPPLRKHRRIEDKEKCKRGDKGRGKKEKEKKKRTLPSSMLLSIYHQAGGLGIADEHPKRRGRKRRREEKEKRKEVQRHLLLCRPMFFSGVIASDRAIGLGGVERK